MLYIVVIVIVFISTVPASHQEMPTFASSCWECTSATSAISDEYRLFRLLKENYYALARPLRNSSQSVRMELGLTLTQIMDIDEKNQIFITNVWLDQYWHDDFLQWDPSKFGGQTRIRVPSVMIWKPDLVLYNNADDFGIAQMPALAIVTYDGGVFWPLPMKLRSSCKVDVTYFPFDTQMCFLRFGSWAYNGEQVDIFIHEKQIDLKNYVENGEWHLEDDKMRVKRNIIVYPCCPEPYPDVAFYFVLRRRLLFYAVNVIFPCVMMSSLTLLVFLLPPDSGEKIALGSTTLLAFFVLMISVAERLPETSETLPVISLYLSMVISMAAMSVVFTVFVLNLHHRSHDTRPVPSGLRRLMLQQHRFLPSLLRVDISCLMSISPDCNRAAEYKLSLPKMFMCPLQPLLKTATSGTSLSGHDSEASSAAEDEAILDEVVGQRLANHRSSQTTLFPNHHEVPPQLPTKPVPISRVTSERPSHRVHPHSTASARSRFHNFKVNQVHPLKSSPVKTDEQLPASHTQRAIAKALRQITSVHSTERNSITHLQEWKVLAQIVDRVLFLVYASLASMSTVVTLVLVPLGHFHWAPDTFMIGLPGLSNSTAGQPALI